MAYRIGWRKGPLLGETFMENLQLTEKWTVPAKDMQVRFVRSSGPGGQNVNKLSTKVELRFFMSGSSTLGPGQRIRLKELYPSQVTQAGELLVVCDEHRSQSMNLHSARERLKNILLKVRRPPPKRHATRPSRGAKKRRLADKRHRSEVKKSRSGAFD